MPFILYNLFLERSILMGISGVNSQYGGFTNNSYPKINKDKNNFLGSMSAAATLVDLQDNGDVLGISMIEEPGTNHFWGMKAKFAECSTKENPVIYVDTNYGGETVAYNININEVDPNNASRLEIFALCSYADSQGIGAKSTFGTYNTLRNYEEMANHNGYIDTKMGNVNVFEQFKDEKLNWVNMSHQVINLLYNCNDIIQYNKGLDILDLFSKYPVE
jgi:hypothetical protein